MGRLLTTTAIAILLATPLLGGTPEASRFAALDTPGVDFAGEVPWNVYLLDEPRPFHVRVSGGAEPSLLVDRNGKFLWIGDTSGLWRSTNGGANWTRSPNPFLPGVVGDGWALAQDDVGRLYVATTIGPTSPVAMSTTGGASWDHVSHVVSVDAISDRPWLAARGDGQVALIVNGNGREECYQSRDAGATWGDRNRLLAGSPNAGNVVFDKDGRLWFHSGALQLWTAPCVGAVTTRPAPPSGPSIFIQVDVDAQGRVYFAQPSPDSGQMLLVGREAVGPAWKAVVVSAPVLKSNTFPTVSVLDSGEIAVGWYGSERAGDPSSTSFTGAWNPFVARVTGFWNETPEIRVTRLQDEPNHVGNFCMGGISCRPPSDRDLLDYFMLDIDAKGTIHVAYGHDGAGSNAEVRYARVER